MVSAEVVGEVTTLADFGARFSQGLGEHSSDCELFSQGEITLDDGTPAYEIVFSGTTEGYTLKCKYVIVIQGTQAFFLMGYSMQHIRDRKMHTSSESFPVRFLCINHPLLK